MAQGGVASRARRAERRASKRESNAPIPSRRQASKTTRMGKRGTSPYWSNAITRDIRWSA